LLLKDWFTEDLARGLPTYHSLQKTMIQDFQIHSIRSAAILTGSYVAGTVINATAGSYMQNQLILLVDFTLGSLTSAEIKVEFSNDGTTYFQETNGSVSSGTTTLALNEYSMTATGKFRIPVPIKDRYIKISAKGTGTVTSSTMTINAVTGVA